MTAVYRLLAGLSTINVSIVLIGPWIDAVHGRSSLGVPRRMMLEVPRGMLLKVRRGESVPRIVASSQCGLLFGVRQGDIWKALGELRNFAEPGIG